MAVVLDPLHSWHVRVQESHELHSRDLEAQLVRRSCSASLWCLGVDVVTEMTRKRRSVVAQELRKEAMAAAEVERDNLRAQLVSAPASDAVCVCQCSCCPRS